ncbi:MAG TPA: hypothetical protein P5550_08615 [Bacteroidales bacterium]|nr:hypothetical protein [Bacteroidales bacterium]
MRSGLPERKILVVVATNLELSPLVDAPAFTEGTPGALRGYPYVDILVTGVGVLPTTYHLGRVLAGGSYDLLLNIGLCGSYGAPPVPGDVVVVNEDRIFGLGAEGERGLLTLREIGLVKSGDPEDGFFSTPEETIPSCLAGLRRVKAITVNTIHSWPPSIQSALALTGARVESMEGAACHYAAAKMGMASLQLRAVSNMVGPRDVASWKIREALASLHAVVPPLLRELK